MFLNLRLGSTKEGFGEGLAKVGERLGNGCEGLAKGLAGFLASSNFAIPEAPV